MQEENYESVISWFVVLGNNMYFDQGVFVIKGLKYKSS